MLVTHQKKALFNLDFFNRAHKIQITTISNVVGQPNSNRAADLTPISSEQTDETRTTCITGHQLLAAVPCLRKSGAMYLKREDL